MKKERDYSPPASHRHELSDDPISQERIAALLDLVTSLKQEIPSIAGLTLYGSLTKGKKLTEETASSSDMDTSLFVDSDKLAQTQASITGSPDFPGILQSVRENPDYNTEGMTGEDRERFFTQIGMEKYIAQRAQATLAERLGPGTPHVAMYVNFISAKNGTSMYDTLVRHEEVVAEEKRRRRDRRWFFGSAHFFMLDVGGGLTDYRKAFFDRLSQEPPDRADALWSIADRNIRGWERIGPVPADLEPQFPKTFSDAKAYYANGGPRITASGQLVL